jgi:hypothetical protein
MSVHSRQDKHETEEHSITNRGGVGPGKVYYPAVTLDSFQFLDAKKGTVGVQL